MTHSQLSTSPSSCIEWRHYCNTNAKKLIERRRKKTYIRLSLRISCRLIIEAMKVWVGNAPEWNRVSAFCRRKDESGSGWRFSSRILFLLLALALFGCNFLRLRKLEMMCFVARPLASLYTVSTWFALTRFDQL